MASRLRPTRTTSYTSSLPPIIDAHETTSFQMQKKDRGVVLSRIQTTPTSPLAMAPSGIPRSKHITGYATPQPHLRLAIKTAVYTPTPGSYTQKKPIITPGLRLQPRKTSPISPPGTPDTETPFRCESSVEGTRKNDCSGKKSKGGEWVGTSAADGVVESGMGVGGVSGVYLDGDVGGVSGGGYGSGYGNEYGCEGGKTIGNYEMCSSPQELSPPSSPVVSVCSLNLNDGSAYPAAAGDDLELDAVFEMDEDANGKVPVKGVNRRDSNGSGIDITVDGDVQNTVDPVIDRVEIRNLVGVRESMNSAKTREHHVAGLYFAKPLLLGVLSSKSKPIREGISGSAAGQRNRSGSMYGGAKPIATSSPGRRSTFTNLPRDTEPGPDPRVQGGRGSTTPNATSRRYSLPASSTSSPDGSKIITPPSNKPTSIAGNIKHPRDRRSPSSSGIREFLDVKAIEIPRIDPRAIRQGARGMSIGTRGGTAGSGSGWSSPAGSYQPRSVFG